jgi:general secretion pathway protein M
MIRAPVLVSRCAALVITIALAGGLWLMLAQPLINSFVQHRASISQAQEMLARYRQLDTTRAQIDTNLQQVRGAQLAEGRLLTGGSTQLVGAQLQNHLKELIEANQGNLTSMQLLPVREENGFQRISMAVTFSATIESLQSILFAVEYQSPYFFLEGIDVRASSGATVGTPELREMQGGPQGSAEPRVLQIQCVVFGYSLIGAG